MEKWVKGERVSYTAWDYVSGEVAESWGCVVLLEDGNIAYGREIRNRETGGIEVWGDPTALVDPEDYDRLGVFFGSTALRPSQSQGQMKSSAINGAWPRAVCLAQKRRRRAFSRGRNRVSNCHNLVIQGGGKK